MKILNKSIHRDFTPLEKYEAGIVLTGAEAKAVRQGQISLRSAHVKLIGSELYLVGAQIAILPYSRPEGYDPQKTRKLLLHKHEITKLAGKLSGASGLTIVPIACYNKGSLIKLEIALSKGKKAWERKKVEKERDERRREEKEFKEEMR